MDEFPLPTSDDLDESPTQLDGFLAFRLELEMANEKLQQYNDIIISQANELKILRSVLCLSCKRKLVEATITPSQTSLSISKQSDRPPRLRQPVHKTKPPGSSSSKHGSTLSIQAISTPSTVVGRTHTGLGPSPHPNGSSISGPNVHIFEPTSPQYKPQRTGTPSKLALHPSYLPPKFRTTNSISSSNSRSADNGNHDSESSEWSVVHSSKSKADLRVSTSKSTTPQSKLPRKSVLHRTQQPRTRDSISSSSPLNSTLISSSSEPLETSNGNGDSESPWSLTHSSDTMASASSTDLLTFPLNNFTFEPLETDKDNHGSHSPWSVTQSSNVKQALDVTFHHAFPHNDRVNCVKFSKDGRYIAIGLSGGESNKWNGKAIIYGTETGMERCQLVEHTSDKKKPGVDAVCFSPNGEQLAVGHKDGHISLWLINAKRLRNMFRGDQLTVTSLDFSPNGRTLVSASLDGTIRLWRLRDGSSRQTLITTGYTDLRVIFSPIGGYVAAGTGDGVLCILDSRTREVVMRWEGHQNDVSDLVFMPDGNGLLSSSFDGTVKYWDVSSLTPGTAMTSSGTLIRQFGGHPHHVRSIAISADGQWVLCGLDDSSARIWNISNGTQECSLHGHTRRVWTVDMSLVGGIALGDIDGRVSLWRMKELEQKAVCSL